MEFKRHKLKTSPDYFQQVWDGLKTFECRLNDRGFKADDVLVLREFNKETNSYSGREIEANVPYVLSEFEGLQTGYIILSIDVFDKYKISNPN